MGLVDAAVAGGGDVGGLVGSNAGSVAGSYTTGIISGTGDRVGGLAGRNQSTGAIRTSYSTTRVSGNASVGGLVGEHDGALTAGYATGRVSGSSRVGGLVGRNQSTGSILASYATAYVSGTSDAGGRAGRHRDRDRQLLGHEHFRSDGGRCRPDDGGVAVADRLHGHLLAVERGPGGRSSDTSFAAGRP